MATEINGIATEQEAANLLNYNGSIDNNKCITKARVTVMGGETTVAYPTAKLVKYLDIYINKSPSGEANDPTPDIFTIAEELDKGYSIHNAFDCYLLNGTVGTPMCMRYHDASITDIQTLWGENVITCDFISTIASLGFKSVRIPITFSNLIDENGEIVADALDSIQEIVDCCIGYNLKVILASEYDTFTCMQYKYFYDENDDYPSIINSLTVDMFVNMWRSLTTHFQNYEQDVIFSNLYYWEFMLNGTATGIANGHNLANYLNTLFVYTVRTIDSTRPLIIHPYPLTNGTIVIPNDINYMNLSDDWDLVMIGICEYREPNIIDPFDTSIISNTILNKFPIIVEEFGDSSRSYDARLSDVNDESFIQAIRDFLDNNPSEVCANFLSMNCIDRRDGLDHIEQIIDVWLQ